jgi:multicomponent Na+:H+ antiporter subunit D
MLGATVGLVAVSLLLTVVAGPLFAFTDRAAEDLLERSPYISAVLPEEVR